MTNEEKLALFLKEFSRAKNNAVYFLEKFYNELADEDNKLSLTDEEKQELFDKYRAIPFVSDMNTIFERQKKIDALKEQGYKDWEIF